MTNKQLKTITEAELMKNKAKELIEESVSAPPGRLSDLAIELTAIKAYWSEKLDNILVFKAERLQDLKVEHKTVAAAKLVWNASKEGRNEILIRGIIGRIKDQVSVMKQRLNVFHDEKFGSY